MTKLIELSQDKMAIVDDEDFEKIKDYGWYCSNGYARRNVGTERNKTGVLMHRQILGIFDKDIYVDHINHDGLDNRRCNLRIASKSQNAANSKRKNSTGYKGVSKLKNGKFRANITVNGDAVHSKEFHDAETAAAAYDELAVRYFGEFAYTNSKAGLL